MIARISKKLKGDTWFDRLDERQRIIDERNRTGEINVLVDLLFKAKEHDDYETFNEIISDIFLEEVGNYFYIKRLFESDFSREDFIKEIDGENCCCVCKLLRVI